MASHRKAIRVGIIGCGKVANERHLPALKHVPGIRVVAAADGNVERLETMASRWAIDHQFNDYRTLLDRDDVDAVGILTPTGLHAEIGMAALDAGKHVLVEKPLALTLDECDRLIDRAADSSCKIVVGFNLRWHRLIRRAQAFIRTGAMGRISAVRSVYTHFRHGEHAPDWHRKLELGGGVAYNEAVHHFDLWRYLLDTEVEQVCSFSRPSEHCEDETHVTTAVLSNGALATGVFSLSTSPNSELEIYGESGRLYVSCYRFDGLEFFSHSTYPGDMRDRLKRGSRAIRELSRAIPNMRRGGDFQATFIGLWQHFVDCVTMDQVSECTLEDGRQAVRVALAAVGSALSGDPVRVKEEEA
jgi:predicted dehydrogenase